MAIKDKKYLAGYTCLSGGGISFLGDNKCGSSRKGHRKIKHKALWISKWVHIYVGLVIFNDFNCIQIYKYGFSKYMTNLKKRKLLASGKKRKNWLHLIFAAYWMSKCASPCQNCWVHNLQLFFLMRLDHQSWPIYKAHWSNRTKQHLNVCEAKLIIGVSLWVIWNNLLEETQDYDRRSILHSQIIQYKLFAEIHYFLCTVLNIELLFHLFLRTVETSMVFVGCWCFTSGGSCLLRFHYRFFSSSAHEEQHI